jgi:hypothetical protein
LALGASARCPATHDSCTLAIGKSDLGAGDRGKAALKAGKRGGHQVRWGKFLVAGCARDDRVARPPSPLAEVPAFLSMAAPGRQGAEHLPPKRVAREVERAAFRLGHPALPVADASAALERIHQAGLRPALTPPLPTALAANSGVCP